MLSGYNADYLSRLCREKKIASSQVGRTWLIERASLEVFMENQVDRKIELAENLARERELEYRKANSSSAHVSRVAGDLESKARIVASSMLGALSTVRMPRSMPVISGQAFAAGLTAVILGASVTLAGSGVVARAGEVILGSAFEARTLAIEYMSSSNAFAFVKSEELSKIAEEEIEKIDATLLRAADARVTMLPVTVRVFIDEAHDPVQMSELAYTRAEEISESYPEPLTFAQASSAVARAVTHPEEVFATMANEAMLAYSAIGAYALNDIETVLALHMRGVEVAADGLLSASAVMRDTVRHAPLAIGNVFLNASVATMSAYEQALYAYVENVEAVPSVFVKTVHGLGNGIGSSVAIAVQSAPIVYEESVIAFANESTSVGSMISEGSFAFGKQANKTVTVLLEAEDRAIVQSVEQTKLTVAHIGNGVANTALVIESVPSVATDTVLGVAGGIALRIETVDTSALSASPLASLDIDRFIPGFLKNVTAILARAAGSAFHGIFGPLAGFFGASEEVGLAIIPNDENSFLGPDGATGSEEAVKGNTTIYNGPVTIVRNEYPTANYGGVSQTYVDERFDLLRRTLYNRIEDVADDRTFRGDINDSSITDSSITTSTFTNGAITDSSFTGGSITGAVLDVSSTTVTGSLTVSGETTTDGLVSVNATSTNATSTNFFATNASLTNLLGGNATITNATSTNFYAAVARVVDGFFTNLTATLANITTAVIANLTATDATFTNATSTNATSTNLFATNLNSTNATSTNFFASSARITTGIIDALTSPLANITTAVITNLTATNSTLTNATSTNSFALSYVTPSRLLSIGSNGVATSTSLSSWVTGTLNQLTVTDNGIGGITLSLPSTIAIGTSQPTTIRSDGATSTFGGGIQASIVEGGQYIAGPYVLATSTTATSAFSGNIAVGRNATLGTSASDLLTVNSSISSNLIPSANNTYDLGSVANNWNRIYVDEVVANNISAASTSISGTVSESFSINSDNATADTEDSTLVFNRGSASPNALLTWNATSDRFEFNMPVFSATGLFTSATSTNFGTTNFTLNSNTFTSLLGTGLSNVSGALTVNYSDLATDFFRQGGNSFGATAVLGTNDSNNLAFETGGTTRMTISTAGRIGVGTTTPAVTFDIFGTDALRLPVGTTAQRPTGDIGYVRYNTTTHQFEGYGDNSVWQGLGGVIDADQDTYITADTNNLDEDVLRLVTAGTERLTVLSGGNVGIGTATPSNFKLQVAGNIGPDAGSTYSLGSATNRFLGLYVNAILANGATGSDSLFELAGGNVLLDNTYSLRFKDNGGTGFSVLSVTSANNVQFNTPASSGSVQFSVANASGTIQFLTNSAERLRITSTGNIGIGTTSPYAKLSVVGQTVSEYFTATSTTATSTFPNLSLTNFGIGGSSFSSLLGNGLTNVGGTLTVSTSSLSSGFFQQGGNSFGATAVLGTNDSNNLEFETNGTTRMTILSGGNVGIGSTSPTTNFVLAGVGANPGAALPGSVQMLIGQTGNAGAIGFNRSLDGLVRGFVGYDSNGVLQLSNGTGAGETRIAGSGAVTIHTNGINERVRIDNSGNVGIGTTSPSEALSVTGNIITSVIDGGGLKIGSGLRFGVDNTNQATLAYGLSGGFRIVDPINGKVPFTIVQNPLNGAMSIGANGVGFATSSPAAYVHVDAAGSGRQGVRISSTIVTSGTHQLLLEDTDQADGSTPFWHAYSNNGNFNIASANRSGLTPTGAAVRLTIDGSGNVGIGTTTPTDKLTVQGGDIVLNEDDGGMVAARISAGSLSGSLALYNASVTPSISLVGASSNHSYFNVTDGNLGVGTTTPWAKLSVTNSGSGPSFVVEDAASPDSTPFLIDASGNVGVGNAIPAQKLDVTGYAQASSGFLPGTASDLRLSRVASGTLLVDTFGTGSSAIRLGYSGSVYSTWAMTDTTAGNLTLSTTGGSSGHIILSPNATGNVGIDTTSPGYPLDVNGAINTRSLLRFGSNSETAFSSSDHPVLYSSSAAGASYPFLTAGNLVLQSRTSGSARDIVFVGDTTPAVQMVIQGSTGNVGIGTTSPYAKLSVTGEGTTTGVNFQTTNSSGSPLFTIIDSGSVGVGTVAPSAKLQVSSDVNGSDSEILSIQNSIGWAGANTGKFQQLTWRDSSNVVGAIGLTYAAGGTVDFTVNSLYNSTYTSTTSIPFIIKGSGNVGIGTTSPAAKLAVTGTGYFTSFVGIGRAPSASAMLSIKDTNVSANTNFRVEASDSASNYFDIFAGTAATGFSGFWAYGASNPMSFGVNGSERMRITAAGNVGIGITNPANTLTVASSSTGGGITLRNASNNVARLIGYETGNDGGTLELYNGGTLSTLIRSTGNSYFQGGNVGIGTTTPSSKLDIMDAARTGTHGTGLGLYVTSGSSPAAGGAEFRHSNGTQGVGIGYNTIYAAGSNTNQDLNLQAKGSGVLTLNASVGGSVGIGTTSPQSRLHIDTGGVVAVGTPLLTLSGNGSGNNFLRVDGALGDTYDLDFGTNASFNDALDFSIGGTQIMGANQDVSRVFFPNGNVGIGATSPIGKLDVSGNILSRGSAVSYTGITNAGVLNYDTIGGTLDLAAYSTGGSTSLRFTTSNAGTPGTRMTINNTGNVGIGTTSPTALLGIQGSVGVSGTQLYLAANGSVGIGTAAPSALYVLDVSGSMRTSGNIVPSGVILAGSGSASSPAYSFSTDTSFNTGMFRAAEDALGFSTGANERLRIDSSGNVGIGTSTPTTLGGHSNMLNIYGSNATGIIFGNSTGSGAYITKTGLDFNIRNSAVGAINLSTSDTNRMTITSAGNVGIGTTTPSQKLDVNGMVLSETNSGTGYSAGVQSKNFESNALIHMFAAGSAASAALFSNNAGVLEAQGAGGLELSAYNAGPITFKTGVRVARMTIDLSGNVGIGTTTPAGKLDVSMGNVLNSSVVVTASTVDGNNAALKFYRTDGAGLFYPFVIEEGGQGNLNFYTGAAAAKGSESLTSRLTILGNGASGPGNVGIGTTTPGYKLQVAGDDTSGTQLVISGATTPTSRLYIGYDTNDNYGRIQAITEGVATRSLLLNPDGGNVGIGTTTPAAKLQVLGNILAGSSGEISNYASGVGITDYLAVLGDADTDLPGIILGNRQTANDRFQLYLDAANKKVVFGNTFSSGSFSDYVFRAATTDLMTIKSTGNVGIGTTTPAGQLVLSKNYGNGSTYTALQIDQGNMSQTVSGSGLGIAFTNQSATLGAIASYANGTSPGVGIWGGTFSSAPHLYVATGGNVGIGTTTPAYKLSLYGADDNSANTSNTGSQFAVEGDGHGIYMRMKGLDSAGISGSTYANQIFGRGGNIGLELFSDGQLVLGSSNTERMRITAAGNVGIGTAAPGSKLEIENAGALDVLLDNTGVGNTTLTLDRQTSGGESKILFQDGGVTQWGIGAKSSTNNFVIRDEDSTERLTILKSNGNVGIGTTSPTYKLDVYGNTARIDGSGSTYAELQLRANGYDWALSNRGSLDAPNNRVSLFGGGTERLTVTSAGNVGIGTTTPATALSVYTSGTWAASFQGTTGGAVAIGSVTGVPTLQGATNGSVNATANIALNPNGGNVGIGTTTASHKLSIATAQNDGIHLYDTTNLRSNYITNSSVGLSINAAGSGLQLVTGGSERVRINSSGNVGIGTTNPGAKLSVEGTAVETIRIGQTATTLGNRFLFMGMNVTNGYGSIGATQYAQATLPLVLQEFGGNVGIGTTSPSQLLSVAGNGYVTGGLGVGVVNTTAGSIYAAGNIQTNAGLVNSFIGQSSFSGYNPSDNGSRSGITAANSFYIQIDSNNDQTDRFFAINTNSNALSGGTELFRVQENGNVGIGTTSPQSNVKLDVHGRLVAGLTHTAETALTTSASEFWLSARSLVTIGESSAGNANPAITLYRTSAGFSTGRGVRIYSPDSVGTMQFQIATASGTYGSETYNTAMQIVNSGYVNIATTTVSNMLAVQGTGGAPLLGLYTTAGAQVLSVSAGGNLGIGTTSPSAKFAITQSANTSAGGLYLAETGNTDFRSLYMDTSGVLSFYGGDTAGALNTATLQANGAFTNASDRAYKENIVDLNYGLADIRRLQPRSFTYKETNQQGLGFIAQELKEIVPEVVYGTDGKMSVDYASLSALALAGVKELDLRTLSLAPAAENAEAQSLAVSSDASIAGMLTVTGTGTFSDSLTAASILSEGSVTAASFLTNSTETLPTEVLTNGNADLFKMASYAITNLQSLSERTDLLATRIDDIDARLAALETGSTAEQVSGAVGFTVATLKSALQTLGIYLENGIAQFETLVFRQLAVAKDTNGDSSAGSQTILAGNTVVEVENPYVLSTSKIFVTFTGPIQGAWYLSNKEAGKFRVTLANGQSSDVSFDYFILQTEGQLASPGAAAGPTPTENVPTPSPSDDPLPPVFPGDGTTVVGGNGDTTPPQIALVGPAAREITVGATWTDPGATASDETDGDLTAAIQVTGTVDTNTPGLYTISYSVSDAGGNEAHVSRIVTVEAGASTGGSTPASEPAPEPAPAPEATPTPAPEPAP